MKLTLAFGVYNKEQYIESVVDSWLSNLSGRNRYEIIVVFDDCKDRSVQILHKYLRATKLDYLFLFADDRYDIFCNNLALEYARGDCIIFIQDDNWIYDNDWDLVLTRAVQETPRVGCIGLLAGLRLLPDQKSLRYERVEVSRPNKDGQAPGGCNRAKFDMGIWQVDSVCRPFGIARELLVSYGGLDTAFSPTCGDDLDLGIKLLKDGFTNIYIPFDIVNLVGSKQTMSDDFRASTYAQALKLNFERHHEFINGRQGDSVRMLRPVTQDRQGQLVFDETLEVSDVVGLGPCTEVPAGRNGDKPPFTIFAMPKAFDDAFAVIQKNAIRSWLALNPRPEVILLGDDHGVADLAAEHGLQHIPQVARDEFGTPVLDDLFERAQAAASCRVCVYINADIIVMDDFTLAVEAAAERFGQFLLIGRRWDFDIFEELDFDAVQWQQRLAEGIIGGGRYHAPTGIDYFAFTKGLWPEIPPLLLGRCAWDNWLVRDAMVSGRPVVDASDSVIVVHQNHGFSHIPGGKVGRIFDEQVQRNLALTGNDTTFGYTSHAPWVYRGGQIVLRPIMEFFNEGDLSVSLRCVESAYVQSPETVEKQCSEITLQAQPALLSRLLPVARRELLFGSARTVARLLLTALEAPNKLLAEELYGQGVRHLRQGKVADAVACLEKAAVNCTTLPNLYYALATAYAQLGDVFLAKKACQAELSLDPDNRGAAELLARIEQAVDEYQQSLAV